MNNLAKLARTGLITLLLSSASGISLAGDSVYRWVDSAGNTVHSDRQPPAGIEYEKISTRSSFSRSAGEGGAAADAQPQASSAEPETGGESGAAGQSQPKNSQYCADAKQNLETLSTSARIRIKDENGEYRYLSEDDKEVEREKARAIIEAHCDS